MDGFKRQMHVFRPALLALPGRYPRITDCYHRYVPDAAKTPSAPASTARHTPVPIPVPMLDLKRQYEPLHAELLQALDHVLQTQQFILGEPVAAFERAAAAQLGVAHALGCSSGTDALWLGLAAAGIGPGHAVITTPFSFFASVSAILRAGATPALIDIDPGTFNLNPAAVGLALNAPQPVPIKAILPVHLYGQCADWNGFTHLGQKFGVKLIEDAAQA
jgi:dTDP-4-amino-4,6-dideoxygalactose transaminase